MKPRIRCRAAFTLVEILVASAIMLVLFAILLTVTDQTARIWSSTTAKVEQFREARLAFDRVSTRLSQATLNTYWDYDSATAPTRYERRSELRFIAGGAFTLLGNNGPAVRSAHAVFFNAPLGIAGSANDRGLANALNTIGYFIEYADDSALRPPFITPAMIGPRWRFRLMEFTQPTENFNLYQFTSGNAANTTKDWFTTDVNSALLTRAMQRVVAENVIALIITPRLAKREEDAINNQAGSTHSPLAPAYSYDSTTTKSDPRINPKNQLPPVVQLTMIALDERTSEKMDLDATKSDAFGILSSQLFASTQKFASDIDTLETKLGSKRLRYRIFTTNVPIRAAKWSREQIN